MRMNEWILFEKDICLACNHPKLMRMIVDPKKLDDTLRVVISCDCDSAVFSEEWKASPNLTIMVGDMTVLETVAMIGEYLSEGKKNE